MATEHIGDMSRQDLTRFVEAIIEQRVTSPQPRPYRQTGNRSMKEVLASMRRNLWTPPPGTKSSLEMLREDRDR